MERDIGTTDSEQLSMIGCTQSKIRRNYVAGKRVFPIGLSFLTWLVCGGYLSAEDWWLQPEQSEKDWRLEAAIEEKEGKGSLILNLRLSNVSNRRQYIYEHWPLIDYHITILDSRGRQIPIKKEFLWHLDPSHQNKMLDTKVDQNNSVEAAINLSDTFRLPVAGKLTVQVRRVLFRHAVQPGATDNPGVTVIKAKPIRLTLKK